MIAPRTLGAAEGPHAVPSTFSALQVKPKARRSWARRPRHAPADHESPMPYTVTRFETTPNPNAVKCVLDASPLGPSRAPRSYRPGEPPSDDPLGEALLAIEGVQTLLIHDGWISIGKAGEAKWGPIKDAVKRVLADAD